MSPKDFSSSSPVERVHSLTLGSNNAALVLSYLFVLNASVSFTQNIVSTNSKCSRNNCAIIAD